MPTNKSVLFLLASVAMQKTETTYAGKNYQWKFWKQKKGKWIKYKYKKNMDLHTFLRHYLWLSALIGHTIMVYLHKKYTNPFPK